MPTAACACETYTLMQGHLALLPRGTEHRIVNQTQSAAAVEPLYEIQGGSGTHSPISNSCYPGPPVRASAVRRQRNDAAICASAVSAGGKVGAHAR
jgi:hypothetical protein